MKNIDDCMKGEATLEMTYKSNENLEALLSMGVHGHFPLFHESWLQQKEFNEKKFIKLTGIERARAKKLFQMITKHRSLDHKKTLVLSFSESDRMIFMKAFLKLVEGKILDRKPEIH